MRAAALPPAALLIAGAALAQTDGEPFPPELIPPPPPAETFMSAAEIEAAFTASDYEGCYPDGSPWAERTAASGALYDLMTGNRVGTWWVEERTPAEICYDYPALGMTACWTVQRRGEDFDFYYPGTGLIGGTTDCGQPVA